MRDLARFETAMVDLSIALRSSRPINPLQPAGKRELAMWATELDGFTDDEVQGAIVEARGTLDYWPRPKQLKALCLLERMKMQQAFGGPQKQDLDHCPQCGSTYRAGRVWQNGKPAHRAYCDHEWERVSARYNLPEGAPVA